MRKLKQIILAFMLGALSIQAAFAGDCDTPKVKKQLVSYVIYGYGIMFYNAPVVSFEKDLGMQMEIREIYKGKKDTLCAVKVTLNALHTKIPNTDAFEKFLYKNNKGLFDSWEHYDKSRTNMENILRIYAYNKWPYKKERLWHFEENETFSHLEQTEGLRFYRVSLVMCKRQCIHKIFYLLI